MFGCVHITLILFLCLLNFGFRQGIYAVQNGYGNFGRLLRQV